MAEERLRIVFMGTPDFAVAALDALATGTHEVVAVYTRPPKPRGRGQSVALTPVHDYALAHGLPVHHPSSLKSPAAQAAFADLQADLCVVAAYGLLLPPAVLDAPRYGCLNIHASLLPRWRGASPIQRAILAGDTESGITIMQMDAGLDTGPMICARAVAIHPHTTARSLHDALAALGAAMIEETVDRLAHDGGLDSVPQDEAGATYAPLLRKEEGRIDWAQSAIQIDRQVRAFTPWPGAWTVSAKGKALKILEAAPAGAAPCGDAAPGTVVDRSGHVACGERTALTLRRIQPESAKAMDAAAAFNGGHLVPGSRLGGAAQDPASSGPAKETL